MVGAHQRHLEAALVGGAAGVHGVEFLQALAGKPHAQIVIGDDRRAGRGRDVERIAHLMAAALSDTKAGLPVKNGSISTALPAKSSRKAEWPYQVICMTEVPRVAVG